MKKINYLLSLVLWLVLLPVTTKAQTDVTDLYLTNADFNTPPYTYTVAGGATITEGVERLIVTTDPTRSGWIFAIPGWENASIIRNNATQVATGEHGITITPPGFNGITPPPTNKAGETTGAVMSMSAGWGDRASYFQEVSLPSGRYVMKYDFFNGHNRTLAIANYFGFIPDNESMAPYYGTRLDFPLNSWITDSISFFLTDPTTTGRINLGITTASGSSNDGPKLFLDNVKLIYYGIDKSVIQLLVDSAKTMIKNPEDVGASTAYDDLQELVTLAEIIIADQNVTAAQVVNMEEMLKDALNNVYDAILLQYRVLTWSNYPHDATEAIVNPSFEQAIDIGWITAGANPFQRQSNASFDPFKVGTFYLQRFVTSGQVISDMRISQLVKNLPNGTYSLTVSAHAIQQADGSYPGGAYLVSNDNFVEIFERKDYNVVVEVVDNTLEMAIEIAETGNWVAFDNFRLSYVSDGVTPYIVAVPEVITFTPSITEATINISGGNLSENVTIAVGSGFTVSKSTLTPQELMGYGGVDVTVNAVAQNAVANTPLTIKHGDVEKIIMLNIKESLRASHGAFMFDQSMAPIVNFTVTADVFSPVTFTLPEGMFVAESSIPAADARIGADVVLMWDNISLVEDKFVYITSGSVKDSVLVFAAPDNLISWWDGDDAEGEGSRLTDFGWSLMQADGETPVNGAFNVYNSPSFGIRYVPFTNQNYNFLGKAFKGHRVAYLRTWGTPPATNVYNLPVELTEGKAYRFRTLGSWHDNGTTPTFSFGINTMMSNLGDTLGMYSNRFTGTRRVVDYDFIVRPEQTDTYYITASSTVGGDALLAVQFMSLYEVDPTTSVKAESAGKVDVYPTIARGSVTIATDGKAGSLKVFDISGRNVMNMNLSGNNETVVLPAEGVYFLKIRIENITETVKIINLR
jgi:hypothetical protein